MRRAAFVLPLAAALLVAAGGSSARTVAARGDCTGISTDLAIHYAICDGSRFVRDGKRLPIGKPTGARVGHWAKAFLAPDGRTLLAQWSAECEVPFAFFVRARGGPLRVVTGERDWTKAPESVADGWTQDGRAIVELPRGACGKPASRPGIYFVSLSGERTLVARLTRRPGP